MCIRDRCGTGGGIDTQNRIKKLGGAVILPATHAMGHYSVIERNALFGISKNLDGFSETSAE